MSDDGKTVVVIGGGDHAKVLISVIGVRMSVWRAERSGARTTPLLQGIRT